MTRFRRLSNLPTRSEEDAKFDMILGGHSHSVLHEPFIVAGTPILQAGSHGRYAGRYDWEPQRGLVRSSLVELPA
jgi:2',3'-cyclic-nucleotide 2'-phosphodiesterase (5'-nucleotidase family)